jgi:quercetin dioxygenase-like cupin family protein
LKLEIYFQGSEPLFTFRGLGELVFIWIHVGEAMMNNKCLFIALDQVKQDPALSPGKRGARKIIVTEIYKGKEHEATSDIWSPPAPGQECPVLRMSNAEMALFNHETEQNRHYHEEGTEIYEAIEGEVVVEVEGKTYCLEQHDTLVVHPFSVHEVKKGEVQFLCKVITLNCGGEKDKFRV